MRTGGLEAAVADLVGVDEILADVLPLRAGVAALHLHHVLLQVGQATRYRCRCATRAMPSMYATRMRRARGLKWAPRGFLFGGGLLSMSGDCIRILLPIYQHIYVHTNMVHHQSSYIPA